MTKLKTILDAKGDASKVFKAYLKHWGELKGFSLALQTGKDNLGETATRINAAAGAPTRRLRTLWLETTS